MVCPRMYQWRYEKMLRPDRDEKPLRFGDAFHRGRDAMSGGMDGVRVLVDSLYDEKKLDAENWTDPEAGKRELDYECITVLCLLEGYERAWSDSQLTWLASELPFELPVTNPETGAASRTFRQAGKVDGIVELPDGRNALLETKTTSDAIGPGSDYRNVLAINQQVSKYTLAAQALGHDVQTTIYDVVRKPTIRPTMVPALDADGLKVVLDETGARATNKNGSPRQTAGEGLTLQARPMTPDEWREKLAADIASRPEYYFDRFEVPRLQQDLDEYSHELWWIADAIRNCRRTGHWFRNTSSCRKFNRLCPYYVLCAGLVDTAGVPAGFRQAGCAHEELNAPEEGEQA